METSTSIYIPINNGERTDCEIVRLFSKIRGEGCLYTCMKNDVN